MQNKKASAIMLTKNRIELAKTAIESFLSQTYENKELIIVNSGSIHYMKEIERFIDFQKTDCIHHVFFICKNTTTIGELRNVGLEYANGDYITTWDDDDFYSKTRIESQVYWIEKEKADFVMFKNFIVKIKDKQRSVVSNENGLEPSVLFKRNELKYPHMQKGEDTLYINSLLDLGCKKYVIDNKEDDYIYNFHGENTCSFGDFKNIIKFHGNGKK